MQVLYTFRLLDNVCDGGRTAYSTFLSSYLAYRVTNEPAGGNPLLNCIGQIAREIFQNRDINDPEVSTIDGCLNKMCSSLGPYVVASAKQQYTRFNEIFQRKREVSQEEHEEHLFAGAIITNTLSVIQICVARDILSRLDRLHADNLIFGSYRDLAAMYGSKRTLEYLLTVGVSTVNRYFRKKLFYVAERAGRADIARFLYDFKRAEEPWRFEEKSNNEAQILCCARYTSSLEVLTLTEEIYALHPTLSFRGWHYGNELVPCAQHGRLDAIRHLIQLGTHPEGSRFMGIPRNGTGAIRHAARWGHLSVVEFLLEHGANPELSPAAAAAAEEGHVEVIQFLLKAGLKPVKALLKAAERGFLVIFRLLLDAGVDANESIGSESPLASAIAMGHPEIFELLIERGGDLHSKGTAEECVRRAKNDGLESMLQLLKAHGIDTEQ